MVSYTFRAPGQTLGDFLRSLAVPRLFSSSGSTSTADAEAYEWAALRARQGGTSRLDFHDRGLRGPDGAVQVLRAMERSPAVTSLTLSHNPLGDDGLRELVVGMKRLRMRDIGGHLEELNLAACGLSDVSLHLIALHILRPSPHPPSIRVLSLNNNHISLGSNSSLSSLPEFFGSTLSSPDSSLQSLTLTSNNNLDSCAFVALLDNLDLEAGPSHLTELRLSVTRLSPSCIDPLVDWLARRTGGARLQVLAMNSCGLGQPGVRKIQEAVISGRVRNLLHLELLANEVATDEAEMDPSTSTALGGNPNSESDEDPQIFDGRVKDAMQRNRTAWIETRKAALGLVAPARILFGGDARDASDSDAGSALGAFPFFRLPVEVQVHVLRCLHLLTPSTVAHTYSESLELRPRRMAALTEAQFLRVLAYSASAATLANEVRIGTTRGSMPSLNSQEGTKRWKNDGSGEDGESGWEEYFLRATGCDRFD